MNTLSDDPHDSKDPDKSVYHNMLRGAGWGILMRWAMRFIGIFNLMIIARLLTPEEIGVVALATLLSGLITQFYQIGIAMLLIRKQNIDRADCDSAWTLRMILGAILALVMAAFAPLVAQYFDEPRMVDVTYVLAVAFFVSSCANIGMVLARRDLDFSLDFRYQFYSRFFTFLVTVCLALWLRNSWAIVFGTLIGSIIDFFISFRMHPYRPRFDLSRYREYLRFGLSIIPLNLGQYLVHKVDAWFVGGSAPTANFVAYNMAADLSSTFTNQIVGVIARGQFPNYSKMVSQPRKLATAFTHELTAVCMLILPIGVGLAVVSEDAVLVLLGDQWGFVIELLPWLAIYNVASAVIGQTTGQILIATGHERLSAALIWVRLAILAPLAYLASQTGDITDVAQAVLIASALAIPLAIIAITRAAIITLKQLLTAVWRPVIAVALMAGALPYLHMGSWDLAIARLAFDVVAGTVVYLASLILLWLLAGRPVGPESALLGIASSLREKLGNEK